MEGHRELVSLHLGGASNLVAGTSGLNEGFLGAR